MRSRQIIICVGLYRSASTWAFNVIAEIARRHGPVQAIYADDPADIAAQLSDAATCVVVKTHVPTPALRLLAEFGSLHMVLTVRDPLDCVASLMDQFGESFEVASLDIAASAAAISALPAACRPLVLRYEDPVARGAETVRSIADRIGVSLARDEAEAIADRFSADAVRSHVDRLTAEGLFDARPPRLQFESGTQWHPGHVGPGHPGRHAGILTPAQVAVVRSMTRRLRRDLGYEAGTRLPISSRTRLAFDGLGLSYCETGFDQPEPWGIWTSGCEASLVLPLSHRAGPTDLTFVCKLAPVFSTASGARAGIWINGVRALEIAAEQGLPATIVLALAFDARGADTLEVALRFSGLVEVDPRVLGFGLIRLDLGFEEVAGNGP